MAESEKHASLKAAVAFAAFIACGATSANAAPILATPLSFDFGDIFVGATSPSQLVTLTNISNTTQTPNFAGGAVPGGSFPGSQNCAGRSLAPGESCQFIYSFAPQAIGAATGSTSVGIDGETTQLQFTGNGISPFLVSATSFDFGNVAVGSTSGSQVVSITNVSDAIQTPNFAGGAVPGSNFPGSQNCAGKTFAPGDSCEFIYSFAPQSEGPLTGSTSFSIDGEMMPLFFSGIGGDEDAFPFLVSPRAFSFGDVHEGDTSPTQAVTITNVSGSPQAPNFAGGAVPGGNFPGSQNCAGRTFAPGDSCEFIYSFSPQAEGLLTASTTFSIDDVTYMLDFEGFGLDPFLVSPLSFDFGEIAVGTTSAVQIVSITNVSGANQTPNFAGGAVPGGNFPGSQNCAGKTFAPGDSCEFIYSFSPQAEGLLTGSTSFSIEDKVRTLLFAGEGIGERPGDGTPLPVPSSLPLLSVGLFFLALFRRKSR
jgi:hypothetical protein